MRKRSSIPIFVTLVFLIPVGAYAIYHFYERGFMQLPVYGKTKIIGEQEIFHTIPGFNLPNQDNQLISTKKWKDKIVIVDFFFSHCPVVCPEMTSSLKRVQASFPSSEIQITSFSIDPERDTPARLKSYTKKFGISTSNWDLLTGDKKEIYRLARNGFMVVATDGDGGPEDFIHTEKLVLVDKNGRIRGYYSGRNAQEVRNLINDIKKLQDEN